MKNQILTAGLALTLVVGSGVTAAQDRVSDADPAAGFYGGVALRDRGTEGPGVSFGAFTSAWTKFSPLTADASAPRAMVFGGYRWRNDLAVEAAFARTDSYALRPAGTGAPAGIGLSVPGPSDTQQKAWNVDVYGSYTFYKAFALYGRLGYVQADVAPAYSALPISDPRRARDGMNYGVGVRYDMSPALGLKLEYARFGLRAFESFSGAFPDTYQVQFGVQYRF